VHRERVAGAQKVSRHRRAHDAEADEADAHQKIRNGR
jgi:hypothetical protein